MGSDERKCVLCNAKLAIVWENTELWSQPKNSRLPKEIRSDICWWFCVFQKKGGFLGLSQPFLGCPMVLPSEHARKQEQSLSSSPMTGEEQSKSRASKFTHTDAETSFNLSSTFPLFIRISTKKQAILKVSVDLIQKVSSFYHGSHE